MNTAIENVRMTRAWAMPSADTFSIAPIADLLDRWLKGRAIIVDPFARNSKRATITNDLNPKTEAQYHHDAETFLVEIWERGTRADAVLFDPPYSPRQVKECYEGVGRRFGIEEQWNAGRWTEERRLIGNLLRVGGICISFGWNTQGIGLQHSMALREVLAVCHGGAHNDTLVTVEEKCATTSLMAFTTLEGA